MRFIILVSLAWICSAKDPDDKLDRYIISCHTTDFECFKRQYQALRDKVLMGNDKLGIPHYEPYVFKYGKSGTCIKLSGLEESRLTEISFDSTSKEFSWTLELPFRIQQVKNNTLKCQIPENEFVTTESNKVDAIMNRLLAINSKVRRQVLPAVLSGRIQSGNLKRFTGNATIQVTYPYELRKKKKEIHIMLKDENLDVILDIPDLSHHNKASPFERNLYELSEWAYSVVQHIDAAQHFALPFTTQLRAVTQALPLRRLVLLYPEEEYVDLQFKFLDSDCKCNEKM